MIDLIYNNIKGEQEYIKNLEKLKNSKYIYILSNKEILSPVIVPIKDENCMMIFKDKELANKYILENNSFEMYIIKVHLNEFLSLCRSYFLKGVTSCIYNTKDYGLFKEKTVMYKTTKILSVVGEVEENIINDKYIPLIKHLMLNLIGEKNLYYTYREDFSIDELTLRIIKFRIEDDVIPLFETEEIASKYCKEHDLIDKASQDAPVTIADKFVLYHAVTNCLIKNKAKFIKFYTENEVITISTNEFVKLILNMGYPQINL